MSTRDSWEHNGMRSAGEDCYGSGDAEGGNRASLGHCVQLIRKKNLRITFVTGNPVNMYIDTLCNATESYSDSLIYKTPLAQYNDFTTHTIIGSCCTYEFDRVRRNRCPIDNLNPYFLQFPEWGEYGAQSVVPHPWQPTDQLLQPQRPVK